MGERFDDATHGGRSVSEPCLLEIRTLDGDVIETEVGGGRAQARSEIASVRMQLASEPFVQLADVIVRSQDVKSIAVKRDSHGASPSTGDRIRSFIKGGNNMATVDREQTQPMAQTDYGPRRRGRAEDWGETKGSPKTTELLAYLLSVLAVAICTAVFDNLDVWQGLILITGLTGAYLLSRGIAKAGSAHREHDGEGLAQAFRDAIGNR